MNNAVIVKIRVFVLCTYIAILGFWPCSQYLRYGLWFVRLVQKQCPAESALDGTS